MIDTILKKYNDKVAAFSKQDLSFVNRFYSDDAVAVAPGRAPLVGIDKIRDFYGALLAKPVQASCRSFKFVQTSPTTAHNFANFSITPESGERIPMKFLFIWILKDGEWFCNGYMYIRGEEFFAADKD